MNRNLTGKQVGGHKIRVAVVIPSWNSAKDLPALLKSLKEQRLKRCALTVILSDNASKDDSIRIANSVYPSVVVVRNRENLGLAGGEDAGIQKALALGMEVVIALNADTVVDSGLVENLVEAYQRHPEAILSPKIYFAPGREFYGDRYTKRERGKVLWYAGGVMDWWNVLGSNRGVDEVDRGQYDKEVETDFATGCCLLIPMWIFRMTGGFDRQLYLYYEDTDLSMKVRAVGGQVWYIPSAWLWHVNAGSSAAGSALHDYFTTRNRLVLGFRWASLRTRFALVRESLRFLVAGRTGQRQGVIDFYLRRLARGSQRI